MSFTLIQSAAREAQTTLAALSGSSADAAGNIVYQNVTTFGTFGAAQIEREMLASGGYRVRTYIPLRIVKDDALPEPKAGDHITRIDVTPNVEYRIYSVIKTEPIYWHLQLSKTR